MAKDKKYRLKRDEYFDHHEDTICETKTVVFDKAGNAFCSKCGLEGVVQVISKATGKE